MKKKGKSEKPLVEKGTELEKITEGLFFFVRWQAGDAHQQNKELEN